MAFTGEPHLWTEASEVHISVAFTWDMPRAEMLAKEWERIAPVTMGGPAFNKPGGPFVPGMYVGEGYTITSRGCPNNCWFCSVPKREGNIRELPIQDGWNILDDNLLACSEGHIRKVFAMLARQTQRPEFTGGLEAKRMKPWIAEELRKLKPESMFFAYDTEDDHEPLVEAGKMLKDAGFNPTSHRTRCYVLCGFPKDTMDAAQRRMQQTMDAGFFPMAMLWRNAAGDRDLRWARFQRTYARPAITSQLPKQAHPPQ